MARGRNSKRRMEVIDAITREVANVFPSFGGGKGMAGNPVAEALKDTPPQFALGVPIRDIVAYVHDAIPAVRRKLTANGSSATRH